ncbi:MAG TPA: bifunctional NADH-specific enoyl-ACP reductase/trans-2-enoyl-CoA reductase [Halieaceae bacterium]|jgi:enoyl-[acyl-carrier protein] reductase/trans-2-enoyl-CoA reductase (NAD+)|uniref:enoyl-ACP reductase FabV n=1 Tax=Haliea TaxID=475794 RepID=UPI000C5728F8|nr:enoyl-ACP reductase FabV [Haliea sp.]HBQ40516.1 bifunctional NADH-specific enoyl-ACP reductase/trans-2-enoyl-CoA reductase [Halieaceae bacterium]MAD62792.1 enoyl-[acyl-carrier-protein] reductase FabV [Haliea sp.]MAY94334.1 enoyl-[acyl-carrier-protein] reductase FabV [Haliea sp.]MBP71028.1 enoyl-[acyl-carrier-protein] reductase FabV [Haliea sp.]HCD55626.1 bifunctional NADH-specific enoyl-ACP reductase/trans-2-enoyl-CoA reductase [Halieaceae bacterium]|tara:strand:- start:128 stop:1318 length:1191 start_codon:yes stop_codon:yes gene_type:complete
MIIKPRVRGFLCTTTHPVGCATNVRNQIDYVRQQGPLANGPKRVLVIGASTGYGLASRITAAFGAGAATLGIFFEKEGTESKPGTAGWYNSAAFHSAAEAEGLYAKSINGDAFSDEVKQKAIATIREDMGQVDLVVYSLASPRRQHPVTGVVHNSTLKPIGKPTVQKGVNTDKQEVQDFHLEPATQEEIDNTVAVMGGEDWQMWMEALDAAGVLAAGAKTTAYTYIGEKMTWDIYWHGTIGAAKQDLDRRVEGIRERLSAHGGDARVSVLKAVVTQASAAIPAMPIYLAILFKVMKARGIHEGCIEQVDGLFRNALYNPSPVLDEMGRLRADGKELDPAVQSEVAALWQKIDTDNLHELSDFQGYRREFLQLFGFEVDGVDYDADVNPLVPIRNMV